MQIIRDELQRLRWTESELKTRAKSDPGMLALPERMWRETTETLR